MRARAHGAEMPWAFSVTQRAGAASLCAWPGSHGRTQVDVAFSTRLVTDASLIANADPGSLTWPGASTSRSARLDLILEEDSCALPVLRRVVEAHLDELALLYTEQTYRVAGQAR